MDDSGADSGCGSLVVKVSDHARHVMSSSPVPLKTRRVSRNNRQSLQQSEQHQLIASRNQTDRLSGSISIHTPRGQFEKDPPAPQVSKSADLSTNLQKNSEGPDLAKKRPPTRSPSPNCSSKMTPTCLYRQDLAKFPPNHHHNARDGAACEYHNSNAN
ncbi:hypothetical protein TNCV_518951 [Trichonephila clavipes]|nr:hypothetical protein TNCV_518951 [Trichonephila clavipes]